MSEISSPRTLEEWLHAAYASEEAGCPPPEAWLEAEAGALAPQERRTLEAHADRCPACAAERDLATLFDAGPAEAGASPEDVAFIVSQLEKASPVRPAGRNSETSRVVPFPGQRTRRFPASFVRFAAAAALVLAVGLGYRTLYSPSPSLPAPPQNETVRGSEVEVVAPVGEVLEIPGELRWAPVPGAVSYRVRLSAVDGTVLWDGTAAAPPVRLPAEVGAGLHRAVVYVWTVEALDANGARLAGSEPVRFRARPSPEP
jgi:hypothetical protein